jgi:hypothetical protein
LTIASKGTTSIAGFRRITASHPHRLSASEQEHHLQLAVYHCHTRSLTLCSPLACKQTSVCLAHAAPLVPTLHRSLSHSPMSVVDEETLAALEARTLAAEQRITSLEMMAGTRGVLQAIAMPFTPNPHTPQSSLERTACRWAQLHEIHPDAVQHTRGAGGSQGGA